MDSVGIMICFQKLKLESDSQKIYSRLGDFLNIILFPNSVIYVECKGSSNFRNKRFVTIFLNRFEKIYSITKAKIEYENSLRELKDDSTDADLKEETLKLEEILAQI